MAVGHFVRCQTGRRLDVYAHTGLTIRIVLAFCGAAWLAGCGQSVGDLGRAPRYKLTEEYAPAAGALLASARGAPVSDFALTDAETDLRRRAYRFIAPAHRANFLEMTEFEAVRSRIWPDHWRWVKVARYADDLHRRYDGPAEARYGKIAADANADSAMIEPFFATIMTVLGGDRSRLEALRTARFDPAGEAKNAHNRTHENRRVVHWGVSSLRWRLMSYAYALERARIEVPSAREAEAVEAVEELDRRLRILERSVADLERTDTRLQVASFKKQRLQTIK